MGKRADPRLGTQPRAERRPQRRHAIEEALDFSRIPALARLAALPPVPPNILEVMRIAAGAEEECREAAEATGESADTLIEAARFYLQQMLFRADADSHRVLGLQPGASRETAREHMRWLLQWVHPDRNDGLEAVYAQRVVSAWRTLDSADPQNGAVAPVIQAKRGRTPRRRRVRPAAFRVPWIENPEVVRPPGMYLTAAMWTISGLLIAVVLAGSAIWFFGLHSATAVMAVP